MDSSEGNEGNKMMEFMVDQCKYNSILVFLYYLLVFFFLMYCHEVKVLITTLH